MRYVMKWEIQTKFVFTTFVFVFKSTTIFVCPFYTTIKLVIMHFHRLAHALNAFTESAMSLLVLYNTQRRSVSYWKQYSLSYLVQVARSSFHDYGNSLAQPIIPLVDISQKHGHKIMHAKILCRLQIHCLILNADGILTHLSCAWLECIDTLTLCRNTTLNAATFKWAIEIPNLPKYNKLNYLNNKIVLQFTLARRSGLSHESSVCNQSSKRKKYL